MRDYTGVPFSRIDDPMIRRSLATIDYFLRDLSRGVARVQNGEVPDGSGNPLPGSIDTSDFFFLPGRATPQVGHGGTGPGDDLTLHSTADTTRGSIFLGDFSEFDEANNRLGIYKLSPAAALEVAQAYAPVFFRPVSDTTAGSWLGQDAGGFPNLFSYIDEVAANDADYISQGVGNCSSLCSLTLTVGAAQSASDTHTLRIRVRRAEFGSANPDPTFNYELQSNSVSVVSSTGNVVGTSFQTISHVLSAGELTNLTSYSLLTIFLSGTGFTGTNNDCFEVSWVELEVAAVPPTNLVNLDTAGGSVVTSIVDNAAKLGLGTGDVSLSSWLTVVGDAATPAVDVSGPASFDGHASFINTVQDDHALLVEIWDNAAIYTGLNGFAFHDIASGFKSEVSLASGGLTTDRVILLPDGAGELVLAAAVQFISNKTFTTSSNTLRSLNTSTGVAFEDNTTQTKKLRFVLSGAFAGNNAIVISSATAAKTWTTLNMTGSLPVVGDDPPAVAAGALGKVDSAGLAAAVGATNLTNGALTGAYLITYYLTVTTANVTDVSVQFQVNYTDVNGAQAPVGAVLTLAAVGFDSGSFVVQRNANEISYQTNVVTQTTSRYSLNVRVLYLG